VTPITVYDIVIGKILCGLSHGTIKGVVVTMVIFLFTPFRFSLLHLLAYLYFIVLGSMIFSCVGTIVGTTIDKPENIGRVQAVIIVPLIFMSGIFFPLTSYPARVIPFIRLLPTTAAFDGARQALLNGTFEPGYALNLAITAIFIFVLAVYTFNKWMEE
jgi:lipooligosaccharide transport system permease protein